MKIKKFQFGIIILSIVLLFLLNGCSGSTTESSDNNSESSESMQADKKDLKIGVSPSVIKELEAAKPSIEELGYLVEIVAFDDYVLPNTALVEGEIDLNLFQHKNYLDSFNNDNNEDLVYIEPIYITPEKLYSNKYESIEELPEKAKIGILQDTSNQDRSLTMMEDSGMITLEEKGENELQTLLDIKENPKNFEFITLDINQAATNIGELDAVFSFGDNMLLAGVEPKYTLLEEVPENEVIEQFSIGVVVRPEDKDAEFIQDIHSAFKDEQTKNNIEEIFGTSVLVVIE